MASTWVIAWLGAAESQYLIPSLGAWPTLDAWPPHTPARPTFPCVRYNKYG